MDLLEEQGKHFAVRQTGFTQDIDELKKYYERQVKKLRDQVQNVNAVNRKIIHSIPLPLLILDETLTVVKANNAYLNTVNKKKNEVVGLRITQVFPEGLFPEHNLLTKIREVLASGRTLCLTNIQDKSSGHAVRYMHVTFVRIGRTENDELIVFFEDITEHMNLQLQLQQAQKVETIETLAAGIAHHFNNILMGIQGHASIMLMSMDANDPFCKRLKKIEEGVEKGADLTQKLLGFAKEREFDPVLIELNNLLLKSVAIFGGVRRGIKIDTNLQENMPMLLVDPCQIEEVLLNIFINAWHAMPNGGTLHLETSTLLAHKTGSSDLGLRPGEYVKLSITDTGVGMDPETQHRIFEPFFTTRKIGEGTGLGLAAAYGIIENHKGTIRVFSKLGEGTTFHIYLPVTKESEQPEPKLSDMIIRGSGTVLLVDDEDLIRDLSAETLGLLGYTVLKAKDGIEGVSLYQQNKESIDLVILDLVMPNMEGNEVFRRIRAINPDAKVLLASGASMNGDAKELIKKGASGFLQKPYGIKAVSHKIAQIMKEG